MGDAKKAYDKAKKGVSGAFKGATKTLTGDSVVGQVNNTLISASTGGLVTANKKGLVQGGNAAEALTGGMASSRDISVSKTKQLASENLFGGSAPKAPGAPGVGAPAKADVDPYLEEELQNARKRGRASTVLAGLQDSGGGTSSRRSLIGV